MFGRLHQKLANSSEAYGHWHSSSWSSLKNASFMLVFSLLIAGVTWYATNPEMFVEDRDKQVLGVTVGPDGEIIEPIGIKITPIKLESVNEYTFVVQTTRAADVWVEYDEEFNNEFYKLKSPEFGSIHKFILPNLESGKTYIYRVGTRDEFSVIKYSRFYFFQE